MKKFAEENRKVITKCSRRMTSIDEKPQEEEMSPTKVGKKCDSSDNRFPKAIACLGILLLIMAFFMWSGQTDLATKCMEDFNAQCDHNNPVGNICNELYDCILKERAKKIETQENSMQE